MPQEPLIGSSFDALAAQRQYWGGLNNQTETGNAQRAAAAQQEANNYFQQVAASRQAAINRQAEMDWMGQQANVAQQSQADKDAVHAHEFAVNTQLSQDEIKRREAAATLAAQKADEATTERAREFDTSTEQQKQLREDDINNTGQAYAATYAASQRQLSAAEDAAQKLQTEHDDLTTEVADLGKKSDKSPEDLQKLSADNARLAQMKKLLPKVLNVQQQKEQQHLALSDKMLISGYVPNEEDGTLTHLTSGKSWTFNAALQKARDAAKAKTAPPATASTGSNYFGGGGQTQTATNGFDLSSVPPGAIAMLKKNPQLAAAFDQKYGQGASAAALGQ